MRSPSRSRLFKTFRCSSGPPHSLRISFFAWDAAGEVSGVSNLSPWARSLLLITLFANIDFGWVEEDLELMPYNGVSKPHMPR